MQVRTFVTSTPDKSGAFKKSCEIIHKYKANISRVSYNKAVDLHTLFIDVEGKEDDLDGIEAELRAIGYLNNEISEISVISVKVRIPDRSGKLLSVLDVIEKQDINISYLNSIKDNSGYQDFVLGLLVENPKVINELINSIAEIYPIEILDYADGEHNLDNTIFYINLANEMKSLMNLSEEKTMQFISDSNRILQMLQNTGEEPEKVFQYIRNAAHFIVEHRGENFRARVHKKALSIEVMLYTIIPPCSSNTYIFKTKDSYTLLDTGFPIYHEEMDRLFHRLFSDWDTKEKIIYITHADTDHIGLLSYIEDARIIMNQKSYDDIRLEYEGRNAYRKSDNKCFGYTAIIETITNYTPVDPKRIEVFDEGTALEHEALLKIANIQIGDIPFEIYEGSGGHLAGEMVYVNEEKGILFTGDNLVNIAGFTEEQTKFNSLAPYLMTSVDMDRAKAHEIRRAIITKIYAINNKRKEDCLVFGGHGKISRFGKEGFRLEVDYEVVEV